MAKKSMSIDFMKIAKTVGGGVAASMAEDVISSKVPMVNNNPMIQKLLPAAMGLAVDLLLPSQPDIASGFYGAAGYKLGKHFGTRMNGTPNAINGTPNAINGSAEENTRRLMALQEKAKKQISLNGASDNYAQTLRNKKYSFR